MHRLLAIALLVPIAGCEMKRALDIDKVESSIEEGIEDQMEVKVDEVSCPDEVWEEKGGEFKCKVETKDGETIKVVVEMRGEGKVKWETVGLAPDDGDDEVAEAKE